MVSNAEKGRLFQHRCGDALQRFLNRPVNSDVSIEISKARRHTFDLATPELDVVAECKAFAWTSGGNVPSAKIAHLREAVSQLRSLEGKVRLYLLLKRDVRPRTRESLAEYFVRLNRDLLGEVIVAEMPEEGGNLSFVCGEPNQNGGSAPESPSPVSPAELADIRRQLLRLLDWIEGRRSGDEKPGNRVSRLRSEDKIPRRIANLMLTVLEYRNLAEYECYAPTPAESRVVRSSWEAVREWAAEHGWKPV
jgi:hypothetical protein